MLGSIELQLPSSETPDTFVPSVLQETPTGVGD